MPDGEQNITLDAPVFPPAIVGAINSVMSTVTYVQKGATNSFQNYKYASDGAILSKVQPAMAEAGLMFFQDETKREFIADGQLLAITYTFTLAHKSGAVWPIAYHRTGMSACRNSKGGFDDKAANKCQTAARKYFILGLFLIPTGEDDDPDSHDGETKGATKDTSPPPQAKKSALPDEPSPAVKKAVTKWVDEQIAQLNEITSMDGLLAWENETDDKGESNLRKMDRITGSVYPTQGNRLKSTYLERQDTLSPANG